MTAEPHFRADPVNPTSAIRDGAFVGRQREMEELKVSLENAFAGRGSVAMLVGEPGIGKTRTAQELAAYATAQGVEVLWGRCHLSQGTPSYWPWVQAIRSYARSHTAEDLRSQMGAGAADIAQVVPEVREKLSDLEPPHTLEPQQARFRLFDSVSAFLMRASQAHPLLVVLDNIHWADQPSLMLLEFLAQELTDCRLLVVGTYRDTELTRRHPLAQTLGELAREQSFQRLPLRGLSEEEVGHLIQNASGYAPPADLVRAVHAQTEGNPLFLTEVVHLLAQEGKLENGPGGPLHIWDSIIPVGVREVIGGRLDRLSEKCNQTLYLASVIGREFNLDLLEHLMADFPPGWNAPLRGDEVLEALEEALASGVIEEVPQSTSRYQFSHVLIQDTLAQELSSARRARLHRRIAEAMEVLYGANAGSHAAELSYHFAQAGAATDAEKLVRYSLLAGEQLLQTYAHEEAAAHFERGLETKGFHSPLANPESVMDSETAALLFGLARSQYTFSDRFRQRMTQEPLNNLERAFDYYARAGDIDKAVAVAEHPVQVAMGIAIGEPELVSRALTLVPDESHYAGRLLATYGLVLYPEKGDYRGAQKAFGRALDIARQEKDPALEVRTLVNAADVDFFHMLWEGVLDKGQRAIELSGPIDDLHSQAIARFLMIRVLDYLGDPGLARQHLDALLAQAERLRSRGFLSSALYLSGVLAFHQGDWQAARDLFDRSIAMVPQNPPVLCARTLLEYQPGNFGLGASHVERLLEATNSAAMGVGYS